MIKLTKKKSFNYKLKHDLITATDFNREVIRKVKKKFPTLEFFSCGKISDTLDMKWTIGTFIFP